MNAFLCICGNFKECDPKTGDWVCRYCQRWLHEHYGKLRDGKLKRENELSNYYKGKRKLA